MGWDQLNMPRDQVVIFKTPPHKSSRIAVPRVIRGQLKLEQTQILKVTITLADTLGNKDSFLGKMRKDGYIKVPPPNSRPAKKRHAQPRKPNLRSHT